MTQKRYMTLYEKVKRKELKIYIYKRLERILKGIHHPCNSLCWNGYNNN